jgi:pimeloyl-ACP methyl ester carboxylesterase
MRKSFCALACALLAVVAGASGTSVGSAGAAVRSAGSGDGTTPLLTGGLLTYSGTSKGEGTNTETNDTVDESVSYSWSTSYLLALLYPGVLPPPPSTYPTGCAVGGACAVSYTAGPGTAQTKLTVPADSSLDSTCTWNITSQQPSILAEFELPGATLNGIEAIDEYTGAPSACTGGQLGNGIAHFDADQVNKLPQLTVPAKPLEQTSLSVPASYSGIDTEWQQSCESGAGNCSSTLGITGTVTLHCVLCVTDIQFKQLSDPSSSSGDLGPVPDSGTYDGNRVEIDATVQNTGSTALTAPVSFVDGDTQRPLPEAKGTTLVQPVVFPAGATTTVKYEWDTSGFAWETANQPHSHRRVEVLTGFGGAYRDITVLPKPVVLVHGWNSDATTWGAMKSMLHGVNPDWTGYAVGDDSSWGPAMDTDPVDGLTIQQNASREAQYIEGLRKDTGAQHVDLVVHSMGGLISRYYIDSLMTGVPKPPDDRPLVSHLIMLGTPNMGSPCAVPLSGVLGLFSPATPTYQLRNDYITNVFDKYVTNQHGVQFSVMAGTGWSVCGLPETGDSVVALTSAWWHYTDVAKTRDLHTSLPGDSFIVDTFIVPRLALDPSQVSQTAPHAGAVRPRLAGRTTQSAAAPPSQLVSAADPTIGAGKSTTLRIPVTKASALDVELLAPATVAATLKTPKGAVAGSQAAGSDDAQQPVRAFRAAKPTSGTWTLTLANTGSAGARVYAGGALEGTSTKLTVAVKRVKGRLLVTASFAKSGKAVRGAKATAEIRGGSSPLAALKLHDDGKAGDARARDGRYSALTKTLPAGTYFVTVKATHGTTLRIASALQAK